MTSPRAAGGWPAIIYTLKKARASGGFLRMWRAMRSKNACKTCALGMGGQLGGMVNERGRFPEVCKKSVQAMAADMQGRIREGFFAEFGVDRLSRFTPRELEHSGRLVEPLIAEPGDKSYRAISWEEAIERVAGALKEARTSDSTEITDGNAESAENARPESSSANSATTLRPPRRPLPVFFYFSGRSSNEAAFLLNLLGRVYGTNNINNCSYFCHQASGVALKGITGSGTASIVLDDLTGEDGCDLLFIIGGNPASNHPRLMRTVIDIRRRGGKVIVINPLKELGLVRFKVPSDVRSMLSPKGSQIADEYIQPHIGGDLALFAGIAKVLLEGQRQEHREHRGVTESTERGKNGVSQTSTLPSSVLSVSPSVPSVFPSSPLPIDEAYLANHTENFDEFRAGIEALSWDEIEASSGIARAEIERIAAIYANSNKTVFAWTMGITHHTHGVDNVRMIAAVAMLRGMLGRPGAGLLPLRGHSNVQGVGSMGVEPKLKWEVLTAMQHKFGITLPTSPGMDTLACIDAAARGEIRFAWHLGGNLFGSCPDSAHAARALRSIDTTVFLSTTLNTGHIHGRGRTSIILPVLARDEEPQSTTQESMFNYVRLSDGGRARYTGEQGPPLSEVEVMTRIFRKVLGDRVGGLDLAGMTRHTTIREAISRIIPGYEPVATIDVPPASEKRAAQEFQIPGRTFHTPHFKTPSGRARFFPVPPLPIQDRNAKSTEVDTENARKAFSGISSVPSVPSPRPLCSAFPLRLMTIRSEGQFNTVVYEDHDLYRGTDQREVILMHPDDIASRGLRVDDRVTVRSGTGEMTGIRIRPADIRPGNAAMYYPEANILVPPATDPESQTPAFKNIAITVEPSRSLPMLR
ncbi:MAG: FdhF/YdeP family oxidoreductase [Phycisphaerales bacterium]|nr:FdhF/YdeP family oxidoreductase [Phycisphaerales bacterium]